MRLLLNFIIFILGGFYTFGDNNCCEQCCEYLKNCCKKEELYLKKPEQNDPEKIKKLVNPNWYEVKKETASFILYEKTNGTENQDLNKDDGIKVKKDKNGFRIDEDFIPEKDNTKKWALFEIIYKKENKENETKYLYCSDIESTFATKMIYGIFNFCKQHISISVIACNTSGVTNMSAMFSYCSSLTGLDLSNFDTKNVTNMRSMFLGCNALRTLNLSNFNTKKVTNMFSMFYNCSSLTGLDLSNFNTNNVTEMSFMFYNCSSLQTVTFNKNLNKNIIEPLNKLGFTEEVEEDGNKITLKKKKPHT